MRNGKNAEGKCIEKNPLFSLCRAAINTPTYLIFLCVTAVVRLCLLESLHKSTVKICDLVRMDDSDDFLKVLKPVENCEIR